RRVEVEVEPLGRAVAAERLAERPLRRVEAEHRPRRVDTRDRESGGEPPPTAPPPSHPAAEQHEAERPQQRQRAEPEEARPDGELLVVDRPEDAAPYVVVRVDLRVQP